MKYKINSELGNVPKLKRSSQNLSPDGSISIKASKAGACDPSVVSTPDRQMRIWRKIEKELNTYHPNKKQLNKLTKSI